MVNREIARMRVGKVELRRLVGKEVPGGRAVEEVVSGVVNQTWM